MKIGILGAGNMTRALARKWLGAGHEVLISARSPAKAAAMVEELGGSATSYGTGFGGASGPPTHTA
mgnify:CR=1 FL=1